MKTKIDQEWIDEHRVLISVAEANWLRDSYSWHVFDWMAYKLRCKYPLIRKQDQIVSFDLVTS